MGNAMPATRPQPVRAVDLKRYAGVWHQVAALPTWFQDTSATSTTATYTYGEDSAGPLLQVLNESRGADGSKRAITGVARPDHSCIAVQQTDDGTGVPGCLLVQFTPSLSSPVVMPFPAPYWILELADDYRYAVVGTPDHSMLWVLSRDTYIADADWRVLAQRLVQRHGYSAATLRWLVWTASYKGEPRVPTTAADAIQSMIDAVHL